MVRFLPLFSLSVSLVTASSAVLDLIPDNFDTVVFGSNKPALVEFFAPWCGHCKNLAPVYEELAAAFSSAETKVSIAKVDADEHKSLGQRFGVQGFPTLKWFDGKEGSEPEDYNGGRDLESLTKFITEKTGVKTKEKKAAPSHVEMLTDSTFKSQIGGDKDVLVAFTAPWCGRKLNDVSGPPAAASDTNDTNFRLQIACADLGKARDRLRFRTYRADRQSRC